MQFGTNILVKEIAKFKKKYPNTNFELELGIPPKLLKKVSENQLHFAFVDNGDHFTEQYPVMLENIWSEQFILVGSKKYYNKNIKGDHSFKQIIECNFLSYVNHGPVLKMWFKHHFKKFPTQFKIGLVVENVHGIINGIQADLGLGVVPDYLVEPRIKEGSFIKINVKDKEFKNQLSLVQLPNKKTTLTEKIFLSTIRATLKQS